MSDTSREDTIREFVRAFNEGDIDAFAATLDPGIELSAMRGDLKGIPAARKWATRTPGGVQQTVVIEAIDRRGETSMLSIRRDWRWAEDDALAGSDEMFWLFGMKDGLISSWRPFQDRAEAAAAFSES